MGILEAILKGKNWKDFELANLKLFYVPYWVFNYDIYQEGQTPDGALIAQETGGAMYMNAITGKLEPILVEILKSVPVSYTKEITHDIEHEVELPVITRDEVKKEVGPVKIGGTLGIPKGSVTISGLKMVYVPIWRVWVSLKTSIQKIEIDGISGTPLNFEEVPERQKTMIEVTQETIEKLKTPQGWVDYSKKAISFGIGAAVGAARGSAHFIGEESKGEKPEEGQREGILHWLVFSRYGQYTLVALVIALLVIYLLFLKPAPGAEEAAWLL